MADGPLAAHSVVAGVLRRGGRVLLAHRSPDRQWYPDAWDLPGGHVGAGEEPGAALRRELREELGVDAVVVGEPFAAVRGRDFRMDVWVLDRWTGEPTNCAPAEHDALAWLTPDELGGLVLADPRLPDLLRAALGH
jgi:8-oxo-dGTP diphosphatase